MGERTFRILYTSDIHGRLFARPGEAGLDAAGREFDKDGNTLIFDGGDLLQGGTAGTFFVRQFREKERELEQKSGRKPHPPHPAAQVMNACVRLYADAANAKTKLENGFDLSDYDERTLKFAFDYSEKLLAIDINIEINQMLDTAWGLFAKYFTREEVAIKEELIQKYWKEA